MIHNEHMKIWDITVQELDFQAELNTPRLLPFRVKTLDEVMKEMVKSAMGEEFSEELVNQLIQPGGKPTIYVMSNEYGLNGAACMLLDNALGDFADSLQSDLVILPSSIHEILLLPFDKDMDFYEIAAMVAYVNESEVSMEDRLSNQIYRYCRQEQKVCMVDIS